MKPNPIFQAALETVLDTMTSARKAAEKWTRDNSGPVVTMKVSHDLSKDQLTLLGEVILNSELVIFRGSLRQCMQYLTDHGFELSNATQVLQEIDSYGIL